MRFEKVAQLPAIRKRRGIAGKRPALAVALAFFLAAGSWANAAEDSKSIYLLGSKSSMAGYVPPPGTYVNSTKYYYSGNASGAAAAGVALRQIGNVTLEADIELEGQALLELPTLLWITPNKILGGNLGFGVITPIGWTEASVDVDARAALTFPNGVTLQGGRRFSLSDDVFSWGDPIATAVLGWHQGKWHWNISGLLNISMGSYDPAALANISFHRWAFDATAAVTWLDEARGHELSAAAGFTFNGENPDTDYRSGTEFHVEFTAMKHLSKAFAIGITGFHYDQITGDSGIGARLGPYEGRVSGIGPNVNYNFQWG